VVFALASEPPTAAFKPPMLKHGSRPHVPLHVAESDIRSLYVSIDRFIATVVGRSFNVVFLKLLHLAQDLFQLGLYLLLRTLIF
jgi:hypothetical protein